MSILLELPAEVVAHIMDYVGSSFFRENVKRLTVCKMWFTFARPVLFTELHFTRDSLQRWMSYRHLGQGRPLIQEHMRVLDIKLRGVEDWNAMREHLRITESIHNMVIAVGQWTSALNNDLIMLGGVAKGSRKLQRICIQALTQVDPDAPDRRRCDYLIQPSLETLLSIKTLTDLELDLVGTQLWADHGMRSSNSHICPIIGGLLVTLKRLRLRLRSICYAAITPPDGSTNLHLNDMVINLSLSNESPFITSATHSMACGGSGPVTFTPKGAFHWRAEAVALSVASPKKFRLVSHTLPNAVIQSLDLLTGDLYTLKDGAEWDGDGEIVIVEEQTEAASGLLDLPYLSD
jgi:hypothetical protein